MRIKDVKKRVRQILIDNPGTRGSDDQLYYAFGEEVLGVGQMAVMRVRDLLFHRKEFNLPTYEAVRRARQKVQEKEPELAAVGDVAGYRLVNEEEYKEFSRS